MISIQPVDGVSLQKQAPISQIAKDFAVLAAFLQFLELPIRIRGAQHALL